MSPFKRTFDLLVCLCLAAPALLIVLPILPLVALETRANPIFSQRRVGRNGRTFTIFKMRTMRVDTPDAASHEVGDSKITRSGRLLRRTKLDELPQLWNVLVGDMSLVGPRPCLPIQTLLIDARRRLGVLALRPGITGPGQVAGLDMSEPEALAIADAAYLKRWSLLRDMQLLFKTVAGGGRGDAAVSRS